MPVNDCWRRPSSSGAICLLVASVAPAACAPDLTVGVSVGSGAGASGGGGAAGSGGYGGAGVGGAGGLQECTTAEDCVGVDNECQTRSCDSGRCGMHYSPAGTPLS